MSDDDPGFEPAGTDAENGPWLSDRQQVVWRRWLAMWRMVDARIERDMQQHGGMPFAYYLVLAMLSEAPDRQMRMNRLSEIVGFSQSRLSHAVARLEALGWVRREQAEGDRRGQIAGLTDAGLERLKKVAPLHAETVRASLFDPLSDEQLGALESIFDAIQAQESDYERQMREIDPQR
ncbi:MarR family winged helix-turn-helix transcriptional regulator [Nakamurella lactea]|uniref:MarR family winged helix-turn-helix transcriptional regulator n=1 Tax=Nakamurella lactea TaxID=459515 RepID=UPI0003FC3531|nr:MarR family transcriptional regulator [Nakamurella lactea]